ncbi:hypothetical protein ANN_21297 [Periplaneta americana]|uniref:Uncharacterized protein n=1 Tax=Periplaneta americana TaxID=6978 RepID=A0ABQ8SEX9_PERAM|nr:hypothetical protein ANN_21297 [Periplaneta americana]
MELWLKTAPQDLRVIRHQPMLNQRELTTAVTLLSKKITNNEKALEASYLVHHYLALADKPHTLAETVMKPLLVKVVKCMVDEKLQTCPYQITLRIIDPESIKRWHVARKGESRNAYRVLVGRPEGKRPLGRPRRRWEDNIKMDLREVGYDDRDWINLAQDRDRWRAYVRAAMNLRVEKLEIKVCLFQLPGILRPASATRFQLCKNTTDHTIVIMQDGQQHVTRQVKDLLRENLSNVRIISRQFPDAWPLESPDLNPCDFCRTQRHDKTVDDVIRILIPALFKNQSDSLMAADGDCHYLCKLMEPVRHRWSISDVIVEIRNTVMLSDCSALRFGIRSITRVWKEGMSDVFRLMTYATIGAHFRKPALVIVEKVRMYKQNYKSKYETIRQFVEGFNETKDGPGRSIANVVVGLLLPDLVWKTCLFTTEKLDKKRIEAFEMWIWRRMERMKWRDGIRNEVVLERVGEERMMLKLIRKRKEIDWVTG